MSWRDDVVTSPYGRGDCPTCGREMNLTKRGVLRYHSGDIWIGGHRQMCKGVGSAPNAEAAPKEA